MNELEEYFNKWVETEIEMSEIDRLMMFRAFMAGSAYAQEKLKVSFTKIKLNKKNLDGSINSYQDTGSMCFGYSVPIDHPKFRDQIEDGIWPAVEAFIEKGYRTVTSCEGHDFNGPQVTVCIEDFESFKREIETEYVKAAPNHTMTNNTTLISVRCRKDNKGISNKDARDHILQAVSGLKQFE